MGKETSARDCAGLNKGGHCWALGLANEWREDGGWRDDGERMERRWLGVMLWVATTTSEERLTHRAASAEDDMQSGFVSR